MTLTRRISLKLPSGDLIDTPQLVPSYSSRGFGINKDGVSEINEIFKTTNRYLTEVMLVSAYDLSYKHLPASRKFEAFPLLTIIDSGGYEVGSDNDLSSAFEFKISAHKWDRSLYYQELSRWPVDYTNAAMVNFDKDITGRHITDQFKMAKEDFSNQPQMLHNFLIKPSDKTSSCIKSTLEQLTKFSDNLGEFDIIGVTEKELGDSMLSRMKNLATLRKIIDSVNSEIPIQVFGSLDPISTCLYFISGGNIFDGLTWLRYAYCGDKCIYMQNQYVLNTGLEANSRFSFDQTIINNLSLITDLQLKMCDFINHNDYNVFGEELSKLIRNGVALL